MFWGIALRDGLGVSKDAVKAAKYFKLSADQGNADGQCLYGIALRDGIGVARNPAEAAKYFKLSADQGNANGLFCGCCLRHLRQLPFHYPATDYELDIFWGMIVLEHWVSVTEMKLT
jgi:hypothetical protein